MPISTYQRIQSELPEYPVGAPFSGIQSEMSAADVEKVGGFLDCPNVLLWNGRARSRPRQYALPNFGESVLGTASFYDQNGARHQVALGPTTMQEYIPSTNTWTPITGTLAAGGALYSFAVVGYKLCFANGGDNIQMWDGLAGTFGPVSADAYPCRFLMELDTHLIAMSTFESSIAYPQRVRWSGANDPTDWISFNAGIADILSDVGPIYGGAKLGQQGVLIHADGVTQMIPTGVGTAPFYFFPLGSAEHGCGFPYTICSLPDFGVFYVAKDNVYLLDTNFTFNPIGSMKSQGMTLGARSAILTELQKAPINSVYGFACVAVNGNEYLSYWIVIPGQSTWIFNIPEGNWTRWTWGSGPKLQVAGRLYNNTSPTWLQLVGAWSAQTSSWAGLSAINPFDFVFLGYSDGSCARIDFTGYSEQPWNISGPQHAFGDRRHVKSVERFRVVYEDLGHIICSVTFKTENGATNTQPLNVGSGTGLIFDSILNTKLSGVYHSWTVNGGTAAGPASFTEFAPLYVPGGEFKNNP